jgi:phosphoribosylglycinamide formyltransferase-1
MQFTVHMKPTNAVRSTTGIMVHLVPDEGVDDGPVLASQEIFFQDGESLEQFEERMHIEEHHLLVNTLRILLEKEDTITF